MVTQPTFKTLEHRGWSERARIYDRYSGRFCRYGIAALLNAAGISRGQSTLDVCCGTGEASLAAAARGAIVTGVDFSGEMIAAAQAKGSNVNFQVGDAEAHLRGRRLRQRHQQFRHPASGGPGPGDSGGRAGAKARRPLRLYGLARPGCLAVVPHPTGGRQHPRHTRCRPAARPTLVPLRRPGRSNAGTPCGRFCRRRLRRHPRNARLPARRAVRFLPPRLRPLDDGAGQAGTEGAGADRRGTRRKISAVYRQWHRPPAAAGPRRQRSARLKKQRPFPPVVRSAIFRA
ncbi:class I SAM-dependent methyltransferase [Ensifer sp. IC4062]|nr:class I SAM-dependent methyltransferase [Ensifer sp. IC4062]